MTLLANNVQFRDAAFRMQIDTDSVIDEQMPMYTDATRVCVRHENALRVTAADDARSKYTNQVVQHDRHGRPIHPQRNWILSVIVGRMSCCSSSSTPPWFGELRWSGPDLLNIIMYDGKTWQDVEPHDLFSAQGFVG